MTTQIDRRSPNFRILNAANGDDYAQALASVGQSLLAIPRDEVAAPEENVAALLRLVLGFVDAARPATSAEEEALLARLEVLALALARAEHDFLWAPPCKVLPNYDHVVAGAERLFHSVEELAAQQVRRSLIRGGDLPPRTGDTLPARCERVLDLIQLLREHGICGPRALLHAAERMAVLLLDARPEIPGELSPREIRNRAYTALSRAFDGPRAALRENATTEGSGVFALADLYASAADA